MVNRRCQSLLGEGAAANDATQDVFLAVVQKYEQLTLNTPSSLLYRMATNICLNKIRQKKNDNKLFDQDYEASLLEKIASVDELELQTIREKIIGHIFQQEQPSTRTIAVMHWVDGFSLKEVAEEVGMSVSGVRKRLASLRKKLGEMKGWDNESF